ncbi:unnamed protein product, partial [Ectocarpus sp. 12 AP-2014]
MMMWRGSRRHGRGSRRYGRGSHRHGRGSHRYGRGSHRYGRGSHRCGRRSRRQGREPVGVELFLEILYRWGYDHARRRGVLVVFVAAVGAAGAALPPAHDLGARRRHRHDRHARRRWSG